MPLISSSTSSHPGYFCSLDATLVSPSHLIKSLETFIFLLPDSWNYYFFTKASKYARIKSAPTCNISHVTSTRTSTMPFVGGLNPFILKTDKSSYIWYKISVKSVKSVTATISWKMVKIYIYR